MSLFAGINSLLQKKKVPKSSGRNSRKSCWVLADFIPEQDLKLGSFFLAVREKNPNSSFMSGRKFLKKKNR